MAGAYQLQIIAQADYRCSVTPEAFFGQLGQTQNPIMYLFFW